MPRKKADQDHYKPFREWAGVLCAFIVVMAFTSLGFVQMFIQVTTGAIIVSPADWNAAMLSLASAALGYLIGKTAGVIPGPDVADATVILPPDDAIDPCEECRKRAKGDSVEGMG